MESRFGQFRRVRVDAQAAESARAVNGAAYTVGNHIVFETDRYKPATRMGAQLLAHELTHVVQQGGPPMTSAKIEMSAANSAAEAEADRVAANVAAGAAAGAVRGGNAPTIARFSDTGHHVVEEAGLAGAGFSEAQKEGVERGNVQRDYSQVGVVGNAVLLCQPKKFGGYKPEEHFDNYMWDAVTMGWRTRGASALGEKGVDIGKTPIDYIGAQLDEVASRGLKDAGLTHLGKALCIPSRTSLRTQLRRAHARRQASWHYSDYRQSRGSSRLSPGYWKRSRRRGAGAISRAVRGGDRCGATWQSH
jgi:hypothetical protein